MHDAGVLVPIAALMIPVVAIIANVVRRVRLNQMIHEERMAAIAKGLPPPPAEDYVVASKKPTIPKNNLLRGLLWGFVGLGLLISAWAFGAMGYQHHRDFLLAGGSISACVGLAYLIFYLVESHKPNGPQS